MKEVYCIKAENGLIGKSSGLMDAVPERGELGETTNPKILGTVRSFEEAFGEQGLSGVAMDVDSGLDRPLVSLFKRRRVFTGQRLSDVTPLTETGGMENNSVERVPAEGVLERESQGATGLGLLDKGKHVVLGDTNEVLPVNKAPQRVGQGVTGQSHVLRVGGTRPRANSSKGNTSRRSVESTIDIARYSEGRITKADNPVMGPGNRAHHEK
ncbi:hypothetical protein ACE6H2_018719 [Prunus campanulata]